MVDRLAGLAVPHHGGLALVGDADGAHGAGTDARLLQGAARGGELRTPDLQRVVLDPAGARVDLRQLQLRLGNDVAMGVKHDAA